MRKDYNVYQTFKLAIFVLITQLFVVERASAQVLDAGSTSTFAINSSGNLVSWGQQLNAVPPAPLMPSITNAVAVTGGQEHALALRSDGTVVGWGGSQIYSEGVVPALTGTFKGVAGGQNTSFALRTNGTIAAWGRNDLGNGQLVTAAQNPVLTGVTAISAGGNQLVVITGSGNVQTLGSIGASVGAVPQPAITDAVAISAGYSQALALRSNGSVAAWGNVSGQTAAINAVTNAVAVSAGDGHSLLLTSDGTVVAAGSSANFGSIGTLSDVVYVSAGNFHSYAVLANGNIQSFGANLNTQGNTPAGLALPTTAQWSTGTSGDYLNSHRWSQGIPSTALSNAVFDASGTYSVNFGNDAQALSLSVSGGGNVTFNQNANDFNAGSSINVSGTGTSLTVTGTGAGSQLTASTLNNSATVAVSGGSTIDVSSISNSGLISIASGGELSSGGTFANTGTIVNNGTITGNVSTSGTGVLSGSGSVTGSGVTANGGILAPGNSVGVMDGTDWVFGQAGTFNFEINDATGVAGGPSGWDSFVLTGTLNITATDGNKFLVDIDSLAGASAGNAANFNPANNYSWAFVTANSITGFAANLFSINSTGFTNGLDGGAFSISQSGNSLFVNFTSSLTAVPEPSSLAILTLGGAGFAVYKRRRKRAAIV